ncbi:MAG TPA: thiamine biosynthesis protein ThiS [Clostridiales bacterium]|nr:thiamine biosynthesis protein ThiS [Clostridiales bacterium]
MLLNNREFEHYTVNMTISDVIEVMRFTYPRLVVKVNGRLIQKTDYDTTILNENDDVKIHHLLAGG